jgi:CRP-like cAMP-binding protein
MRPAGHLGAGDFFGELALLDDSPRSATAEALEPTETLTLHREEFMRYIHDNPEFALHVLHTMAQHIRRLNSQISDIFFPGFIRPAGPHAASSGRTARQSNGRWYRH